MKPLQIRSTSVWLVMGIAICAMLLINQTTYAQSIPRISKTEVERVDPKALIGHKSYGQDVYPDGWKTKLATGYGGNDSPLLYGLENKQRKQYALLLKKMDEEGLINKTRTWTVKDAVEIKDSPTNNFKIARRCYFGKKPEKLSEAILAEVRFKRRCDMTTTQIQRAWRVDFKKFQFEKLSDTKGLTCEYGHVSVGEPDDRRGCPTFNYVE